MAILTNSNPVPYLDTKLLVETHIRKHTGELNRDELWQTLSHQVLEKTYQLIIDDLLNSGKIIFDHQGKVCWIYNPELYKIYATRLDLIIR